MPWTPAGKLLSEAAILVFRANGLLVNAGDELAAPSGLTSARWQVLGVIDHGPATQSEVARVMGLTRQSVRETAMALHAEGLIESQDNPSHRRVKLMAITEAGRRSLRAVEARQALWANRSASRLSKATLEALVDGMEKLCAALAAGSGDEVGEKAVRSGGTRTPARPRAKRKGTNE
jgi:DNA-binding MarR family transcriptional regulator